MQKLVWVPIAAVLTLVIAPLASAHAQDLGVSAAVNVKVDTRAAVQANNGNASTTRTNAANATTGVRVTGKASTETHGDTVATFVRTLLSVADREGGIGAEVRTIARSQSDSASTSANAMAKIESRSVLRSLLLGADYKNIGRLRSELATTSANIAHLKALLAKTADVTVKADLETQIEALESVQASTTAFVTAHENAFSFFGWFTKLFN